VEEGAKKHQSERQPINQSINFKLNTIYFSVGKTSAKRHTHTLIGLIKGERKKEERKG